MKNKLIAVLLIALGSHNQLQAGSNPELDYFSEIPIVLSATRLSQKIENAPASVTIITRDMIDASGARTIADIFRLVPGFLVLHDRGNKMLVAYHGLADKFSRQMQILIDGRSVYIPSFGGVSWSNLPLSIDDIFKIEIIRGPNAVTYGANSFQSVINIHTYSGASLPSRSFHTMVKDIHDFRTNFRIAGIKNNLEYRITGETDRDDIFPLMNDKRIANHFNARFDYRLTANDSILLQAGILNGRIAEGFFGSPDNPPRDVLVTNQYIQAKYKKILSPDHEFHIQAYINRNDENDDFVALFAGGMVPVDYDIRSDRTDVEFQHSFRLNQTTRAAWGINTRVDTVRSATYIYGMNSVEYRMNRAFGNVEWFIRPNLSTNIGTMLEDNNFTGFSASPRYALNYTPVSNHTFRVIYSKATRTPSVLEERSNTVFYIPHLTTFYTFRVGNANLSSESIESREIGYYGKLSGKLNLDVKLFNDNIDDMISIVLDKSTGFRTFANTDDVNIKGAELQLQYSPDTKNKLFLTYARLKSKSADTGDNFSTSVPTHTFSLLYTHKFNSNVSLSTAYYDVGKYQPLDGNYSDGYERLDFNLSRKIRIANTTGKIGLVGQNVLKEYVEYRPQTAFGSTYYLTFELNTK